MTSSMSAELIPVRSTSPLTTVEASSVTDTSLNMPPYRPTGVRRGSQMTASATTGPFISHARLSAVDGDRLAGQEVRSLECEVGDEVGELVGVAHPMGGDTPDDLGV